MDVRVSLSCPVVPTFRVKQVAGLFDVPLKKRASVEYAVEVPNREEDWKIGAIVGPSGSGKSSVAREAFADALYSAADWPAGDAIVEAIGGATDPLGQLVGEKLTIHDITHMLTAVGFSSPPDWIKPYHVLSNGQKFRCDLARALLAPGDLVAFDEFTSVVDRQVAQVASLALRKSIDAGKIRKRFVAVTCHHDVLDWLNPDWVLDMSTQQLARGCLRRRPPIDLEIVRCSSKAWRLFAPHHYLDTLNPVAQCFLGVWREQPVCFAGTLPRFGRGQRISRIVVLPDFQGVGIGSRFLNAIASLHPKGTPVTITASHPSIIWFCRHSPHWRTIQERQPITATGDSKRPRLKKGRAAARAIGSYLYIGPRQPATTACKA